MVVVDFTISRDSNIWKKENKKLNKYQMLKEDLERSKGFSRTQGERNAWVCDHQTWRKAPEYPRNI